MTSGAGRSRLTMKKVDELGEADRESVWRCPDCTVAWIRGHWCRLNRHQWAPLAEMPAGPFYRIDHPDYFSDFRDNLFRHHT
jgi:hypothetical protein